MFILINVLNVFGSFSFQVSPAGASLFCQQQQKSKQKNAAPATKLLFKKLNKSAFFTPVFCGAAELTNYKQHNSLRQSSLKAPQKSLVHQLV